MLRAWCLWLLACGLTVSTVASDASTPIPVPPELGTPDLATIPWPDDRPATAAQIALGAQLFVDPRLSADRSMSCASCHDPQRGFSDGLPTARGRGGKALNRNTPGLTNVAWNTVQFWDGRRNTLEEQALVPITHPDEMALPADQIVPRLSRSSAYRQAFATAYPDTSAITVEQVLHAIASFERSLISRNSPFDRYAAGDHRALTDDQQRGLSVFLRSGCLECHRGPQFSNESFQNIGLRNQSDPGRAAIIPDATFLRSAFKTPSLRNVALTAPYFHDGSAATLDDVVDFYDRGGDGDSGNPLIKPLGLIPDDKRDLVSFLHSLTEPIPFTPAIPPADDP